MASVPEFAKKARSKPESRVNFSARGAWYGMVKKVRNVQKVFRTVAHRGHDFRVVVTQRIDRQAAEEIQILLPRVVVDVAPLTAHGEDGQPIVGGNQYVLFEFSNLFVDS